MTQSTELVIGYSPYLQPYKEDGIFPFHLTYDRGLDLSKHSMDEVDALLLWGGDDIHPSFYNRQMHRSSQAKSEPTQRDWFEWELMREAHKAGKPIIGVCRGAQFLCALAGGILVQDVNGHHGHHPLITEDGVQMLTSSCHHQMMYPWEVEHKLMAWAFKPLSFHYAGLTEEEKKQHTCEPEVVYFPEVNGLAIQGHPEWMPEGSEFVQWCNEKVIELFYS